MSPKLHKGQGTDIKFEFLNSSNMTSMNPDPFHLLPSFILPTPLQGKYDTRSTDEEGKTKETHQLHTTSQHLALTGSLHHTDLYFTGCIRFLLLL